MARIDRQIEGQEEVEFDLRDLMSELSAAGKSGAPDRNEVMACFLSSAEGWKDARELLRGRFAWRHSETGLTKDKE